MLIQIGIKKANRKESAEMSSDPERMGNLETLKMRKQMCCRLLDFAHTVILISRLLLIVSVKFLLQYFAVSCWMCKNLCDCYVMVYFVFAESVDENSFEASVKMKGWGHEGGLCFPDNDYLLPNRSFLIRDKKCLKSTDVCSWQQSVSKFCVSGVQNEACLNYSVPRPSHSLISIQKSLICGIHTQPVDSL